MLREVKEETGLIIIEDSIKEYGMIQEIRKSWHGNQEIFNQKSYYYFAEVEIDTVVPSLQNYEIELEFMLEWVDINHAIKTNIDLSKNYVSKFLLREAEVLK